MPYNNQGELATSVLHDCSFCWPLWRENLIQQAYNIFLVAYVGGHSMLSGLLKITSDVFTPLIRTFDTDIIGRLPIIVSMCLKYVRRVLESAGQTIDQY